MEQFCEACGQGWQREYIHDRQEDFTLQGDLLIECPYCKNYSEDDEPHEDPVQADADVLASAGWGTDEDYGCYDSGEW